MQAIVSFALSSHFCIFLKKNKKKNNNNNNNNNINSSIRYVRCIKPNETKSALAVDEERFRHQLRYLGLLENVRVRRAGFCFRQTYERFLGRYKMTCPSTWIQWRGPARAGCEEILKVRLFVLLFGCFVITFCLRIVSQASQRGVSSWKDESVHQESPNAVHGRRSSRCKASKRRHHYSAKLAKGDCPYLLSSFEGCRSHSAQVEVLQEQKVAAGGCQGGMMA